MITSIIKNKWTVRLMVLGFWLGIWQICFLAVGKEILLVSPFGVLQTLFQLAGKGYFWQSVAVSLYRIMGGFLAALFLGAGIAAISTLLPVLYTFLYPIISLMRAAPVASFIILALVWMKTGQVPVFISFLTVFPIVWTNVVTGIRETEKKLLEVSKVYQFGWLKTMRLVYLPSLRPYFFSALQNGVGIAFKSGIAAEVICTPKFSMGKQLYDAKIYLETHELFAWTLIVIVLSVSLEKLLLAVIKKENRRKPHA